MTQNIENEQLDFFVYLVVIGWFVYGQINCLQNMVR